MSDSDKLRAALLRLGETVSGIVSTAEEKSRERCPYKTAASLCAFHGGCQNQRRGKSVLICSGDDLLCWEPASKSLV